MAFSLAAENRGPRPTALYPIPRNNGVRYNEARLYCDICLDRTWPQIEGAGYTVGQRIAQQFVGSIADCLKNEMAAYVIKNLYLAVMFDSATDCSVQETEAAIVRYVRNGHPVN